MNFQGVYVTDDCFDETFHNLVIEMLKDHGRWTISSDNNDHNIPIEDNYSDAGLVMHSYDIFNPSTHNENKFSAIATLIFNYVLQKQKQIKFKDIHVKRFTWNYYNKGSSGVSHFDINEVNHCSIVYYFNTCDAYTIINSESIKNKAGRAIFFDSRSIHRGTGLTKDKFKFALNIVFEYTEYKLFHDMV